MKSLRSVTEHNSSSREFHTLAVFNLEISQSGSYVPHGILNWVVSKMVWVKLWYWNFEQFWFLFTVLLVELEAVGSWSSGGWLIELTSPASPSLSSPSSCFSISGSTAILFCVKNELSFCCRFIMKRKQKNKVNKRSVNRSAKQRMQKVELYAPVSLGIAWNA